MFSKNCPTIVIKEVSSGKTVSSLLNPKTSSAVSKAPELTDDEQTKLNEGVQFNLFSVDYGLFLLTFFYLLVLTRAFKKRKKQAFQLQHSQ